MKHRWVGGLLLAGTVALGACVPTDSGGGGAAASPSVDASDEANQSAAPMPTDDNDEY